MLLRHKGPQTLGVVRRHLWRSPALTLLVLCDTTDVGALKGLRCLLAIEGYATRPIRREGVPGSVPANSGE